LTFRGCDAPWRGADGNGTLVLRSNDKMLEGLYTIVVRISGNKDPMNDDNATLEIGYSPDQIMKDARGNVGADYSYRIINSEQYTRLKARIKDGVVETEQADIHMPQIAWFYNQTRAWSAAIATFATCTPRMSSPRTAASRAFASMKITSPSTTLCGVSPTGIPSGESDQGRKRAFDATSAAMIKAVNTLVPQPMAPGSGEAQAGRPGGVPIERVRGSYRRNRPPAGNPEGKPAEPDPR
jgi:hypothetical protein